MSTATTPAERIMWITGAGSGMGRATALAASDRGWRVAVSGRRPEPLHALAAEIERAGGQALALPLDVADAEQARAAHDAIAARWGAVTDLVYAAGLNAPRRYWRDQVMDEFAAIVETNLTAVARFTGLVLDGMRDRGEGTVVVVSSYSGWQFQPDAGVAYSASKTAVSALCRTLNAQEGVHGIRASNVCPGDVDTDFLRMRPTVPDAAARTVMLAPDDVAEAILFIVGAPPHVRIDELVLAPTGIERR